MFNTKQISEIRSKYKRGAIIELTAPLDDPFSPKNVGDRMRVEMVDDIGQIHGVWLAPARGSLAVIVGEDSFRLVE